MNNGLLPPQAIEVEDTILGTLLIEPCADEVFEILTANDFYKSRNKTIFQAIQKLYSQGNPYDIVTVQNYIKENGSLDEIGGQQSLIDLTRTTSLGNIEYNCHILKEKAILRGIITSCHEIVRKAYEPGADAYEIADLAQSAMFSFNSDEKTLSILSETLIEVMSLVNRIQESGQPMGIRTGLDIDDILRGFKDGHLYILGARPSQGKTALVMTIMREMARKKIKSGMISLETTDETLGIRLISQQSGIPVERITSGQMSKGELNAFLDACQRLSDYGIYIDDKAALTAQQVRSKCRILASKGCKVVFVDFLQLIQESGRNKHEEIGKITKTLKQVSKELNIPVVCLSQLSREVEKRADKRPMLADLRESGSIEEDADCVMFLYRPEYYGNQTYPDGSSTAGIAEIIIAKNKDGRVGTKKLLFQAEIMRFSNIQGHIE